MITTDDAELDAFWIIAREHARLTGVPVYTERGRGGGCVLLDGFTTDASGLTTTEAIGRAGVHRINEGHAAIAPLRSLASPIEVLTRVVEETARDVEAVIVFGSVARGDAHVDSDVDLAVIAPATWDGRVELQQAVQERLGNGCDVLHLTGDHFKLAPEDREPVVSEILRDGIALVGTLPRRKRVAS